LNGAHYRTFLEEALEEARRWGPNDGALLRQIELGTSRLLLEPAARAEATLPRGEVARLQRECQDALRPVWERGALGREITHWPSGPGSARAMELIYRNEAPTGDVASHYTESFLLTRDLAHAVRSRRNVLREALVAALGARGSRGPKGHTRALRVVDLACGPCQSLREALPSLDAPGRIELLGVDTDAATQAENADHFQRTHGLPWRFETANARTLDLGRGELDLVYSTGLFDYVGSSSLAEMWRRIYASLAPGGLALLSVKDGTRFCPLFYRWAIPWSQFHIRTEKDFATLVHEAGMPPPERMQRDATGCVLFYFVRKR
jgi:SAM-dependent methyltransferase